MKEKIKMIGCRECIYLSESACQTYENGVKQRYCIKQNKFLVQQTCGCMDGKRQLETIYKEHPNEIGLDEETARVNNQGTVFELGNGLTWQGDIYTGIRFELIDSELVEVDILYEGTSECVGIYPIELITKFLIGE